MNEASTIIASGIIMQMSNKNWQMCIKQALHLYLYLRMDMSCSFLDSSIKANTPRSMIYI
jgi:shikimate kinase